MRSRRRRDSSTEWSARSDGPMHRFPRRASARLLGAIGVTDGHTHYCDRMHHWAERRHAGETSPGADNDRAADLLTQDPVRRTHIPGTLRGGRRSLQPEAGVSHRLASLVNDGVVGTAPVVEREVESLALNRDSSHPLIEDTESFVQQLLSRLVALADDEVGHLDHHRPPATTLGLDALVGLSAV